MLNFRSVSCVACVRSTHVKFVYIFSGDDYMTALKAVYYYRQCLNTSLVQDFVTFHFYFPFSHMPNSSVLTQAELVNFKVNCDAPPGKNT